MTSSIAVDGFKVGLADLFTSQKFADFIITCGPYMFPVHKAIISSHSEYFKAACQGNFREGRNNAITLEMDKSDPACIDPDAVKRMIHYFYHFGYEVDAIERTPVDLKTDSRHRLIRNDGNPLAHAKVFAAAVKYQVPTLRRVATTNFKLAVQYNWAHSSFAEVIIKVHSTTSSDVRDLRDIVSDTLISNEALWTRKDIDKAVASVDGLAFELLRKCQEKLVNSAKALTELKNQICDQRCVRCNENIWGHDAMCEDCVEDFYG